MKLNAEEYDLLADLLSNYIQNLDLNDDIASEEYEELSAVAESALIKLSLVV